MEVRVLSAAPAGPTIPLQDALPGELWRGPGHEYVNIVEPFFLVREGEGCLREGGGFTIIV